MIHQRTFKDLGLSDESIMGINKKGFEEPTSIQVLAIPVLLKNETSIIAQAQTGTGKTAAFGLPLIELIDAGAASVQALILVPTRELAIQVAEEINSLKGSKNITTVPIYGGQSIDEQLRRLKKGVHMVVGTPGRVIDHLRRKTLNLMGIQHLVLDEADEMLNMGFIDDMEAIMKQANPQRKTLLFSATMPDRIKELARKYMDGYKLLSVEKEQGTTDLTEQIYFEVRATDRFEALCRIIDIEDEFYGLVFCRTKNDVDSVVNHLISRGYDAEALHGDISQPQREKTLGRFKKQIINIIVATDVAARGIDVNNLTHVINYSLPEDPESYVHRIGRTGRAGKQGTAITFVTPGEYKRLQFIQRFSGTDIKRSRVPGVAEIITAKKKKINDDVESLIESTIDDYYHEWARELVQERDPGKVLAALLNYCFEEDVNPEYYGEIRELKEKATPLDQHGKARLFVALGKKDKIDARKLVDLITSRVSMRRRNISDIQVMDKFSMVTVPFDKAEKIVKSFREKGKKPLVTHARPKSDKKK